MMYLAWHLWSLHFVEALIKITFAFFSVGICCTLFPLELQWHHAQFLYWFRHLTPSLAYISCPLFPEPDQMQEPLEWARGGGADHRIVESFELEGNFKGNLFQQPYNEQGQLQQDHVVQSPIQTDPECLQWWGIHYLSGQPAPVLY